jgi:acetylornithine deacetylase/succinyl-diaminopimelate desuccinylase-like protein
VSGQEFVEHLCRIPRNHVGAPTVLLYAHHDVQPAGDAEAWKSPPFEPTERDGRLFGRGAADDKAGILTHVAAVDAWVRGAKHLPVNVKLVIEGEEEIGSGNLGSFLQQYKHMMAADFIVLSDTANFDTGIPALTYQLRGICQVDVEVQGLDHPIHSGMWGGPVPDAATALAVLLGRLVDAQGRIAVPGLEDDVPALTPAERAELERLPFDAAAFRREAGMPAGAAFSGDAARGVYERIWYRPALALIGLEAMPLAGAANQLVAEAHARVSVRVAPGQDAERVRERLVAFLHRDPPLGVQVETHAVAAVSGWKTRADGPAFAAARRALHAGYGCDATIIGCGGTIPFVGPFVDALRGVPALLLGLEDPICNAHSENESLHLGDYRCAARSSAHLLEELSRVISPRGQC